VSAGRGGANEPPRHTLPRKSRLVESPIRDAPAAKPLERSTSGEGTLPSFVRLVLLIRLIPTTWPR
jgi:hypothetical protein